MTLLEQILEPGTLHVVFQPIVEVAGEELKLHAFECLMRGPRGTAAEDPAILFDYVRRKKEEVSVDRTCVATALREAARFADKPDISVNVHASTLGRDPEFLTYLGDTLQACGIEAERLILEIVEHESVWQRPLFVQALLGLKDIGVRVAVDDIGNGQSNYRMLLDARPDYFKIDRYFVRGATDDFYRQAILESVSSLARKFGARVVAEGVEELAELKLLASLGCNLIQGYLFSQPRPAAELARWRATWPAEAQPAS